MHALKFANPVLFLSTLSLRRATQAQSLKVATLCISIHALLAESDGQAQSLKVATLCISIHALLAESDARNTSIAGRITLFLSTLSLRRATTPRFTPAASRRNFYPRSPCGERPGKVRVVEPGLLNISIHALLAESDKPRSIQGLALRVFLSTLSLRRATI